MCNRYAPARGDDPTFDLLGRPTVNLPIESTWRGQSVGPFAMVPIIRPGAEPGEVKHVLAQWGLIRPGAPTRREVVKGRPRMTNNARSETIAKLPTFRDAWAAGQRCIFPAWSYDEPNWQSGKNVWWSMRRADGAPWGIAGLWSEWIDRATGEVVPSCTMPTINVDTHPLLSRMHKPNPDAPTDAQDKRGIVPLAPEHWRTWLYGTNEEAFAVLNAPSVETFDASPTASPHMAAKPNPGPQLLL